jgi:drug/metabolite transporter (DMT)-like permease
MRFTVTFLVLNVLVLTRVAKVNYRGKRIGRVILLGILQPALYFVLENYGIMYTTTSFTGLMSSVNPVFTAILGALLLKERPNMKQWVCIVLSIIGVMIVSVGGTGGQNTVGGCLCLLAAYFVGSFYSLYVRKLTKTFTPFELTYVMFTVGFVFFAVLAFAQYGGETVGMLGYALGHGKFIASILYLGGVASCGAYMMANYSLSRLTVARSTIFGNFGTVVSVLAGVVIMSAISCFLPMTGSSSPFSAAFVRSRPYVLRPGVLVFFPSFCCFSPLLGTERSSSCSSSWGGVSSERSSFLTGAPSSALRNVSAVTSCPKSI